MEYEDDYVLFSHTGDYGWWCPVDGLLPASVKHPDIYFGVAYLEEQGIFGQRLYRNGKELLRNRSCRTHQITALNGSQNMMRLSLNQMGAHHELASQKGGGCHDTRRRYLFESNQTTWRGQQCLNH